MKKYLSKLIFSLAFIICAIPVVSAKVYSSSETSDGDYIPDDSYIIGSYMFNSDAGFNNLYDGNVNTAVVMLGSSSLDASTIKSQNDFVIYYKLMDEFWMNSIDGSDIKKIPASFDILYVNGVCVDPACMGDDIQIEFSIGADYEYFEDSTFSVKPGEMIGTQKTPIPLKNRPGYSFAGWKLKNSTDNTPFDFDNTEINVAEGADRKLTFVPMWQRIYSYQIIYNGITDDPNAVSVTCDYNENGELTDNCKFKEIFELNVTKREGYDFAGWGTSENGKIIYLPGSSLESILGVESDIKLYAIWNQKELSITYDLKGGSYNDISGVKTKFTPNSTINLVDPVRTGYKFTGWTLDGNSFDGTISSDINDNITLVAQWDVINVKIEYELNNGSAEITNPNLDYNDCVTTSVIPTREGYEFIGWKTNDGHIFAPSTKLTDIESYATGDADAGYIVTLTAKWGTSGRYSIEYVLDGGSVDNLPTSYFAGEENVIIPEPTKTGYHFTGWTIDNVAINNNTIDTSNPDDITLTAGWEANNYTIKLMDGENQIGDTIDCTYGIACSIGNHNLSTDDKVFRGWAVADNKDVVYYGDGISVKNLTADNNGEIELYAVYENIVKQYFVYFNLAGGNFEGDSLESGLYDKNRVINFNDYTLVKAEYEFAGWAYATDDTLVEGDTLTVTDNVVLVATWNPQS